MSVGERRDCEVVGRWGHTNKNTAPVGPQWEKECAAWQAISARSFRSSGAGQEIQIAKYLQYWDLSICLLWIVQWWDDANLLCHWYWFLITMEKGRSQLLIWPMMSWCNISVLLCPLKWNQLKSVTSNKVIWVIYHCCFILIWFERHVWTQTKLIGEDSVV